MKYIMAFLILFISLINAKAQQHADVIYIGHTMGGGNRNNSTLIGINNKALSKAGVVLKVDNIFSKNFVLCSKSLKIIQNYIISNCNTANPINELSWNYFIIRVITEEGTKVCYLADEKSSIPYFEKLVKTISKQSDCQKLVADFNSVLKGLRNSISR